MIQLETAVPPTAARSERELQPLPPTSRHRPHPVGAWLVVAAAVSWGLWELWAETSPVPLLNDSAMHEQMVQFATSRFLNGHLPLVDWYPYLGLGSPHFLHYQSLPAMIAGLAGLAVGPNAAFRWSTYLLLATWPVSVYWCARLFSLRPAPAAACAAMSPFVSSFIGLGFEQKAYVWIGYGVWAQLWASWTLPLAWGFTWRALKDSRYLAPAILFVSLTICLHFETGYLALAPIVIWPFIAPDVLKRVRSAAIIVVGALITSAWVTVPLIYYGRWAPTNEILRNCTLSQWVWGGAGLPLADLGSGL